MNHEVSLVSMLQSEVESRTQGLRPRPRTPKKSEVKVKDSPTEDRPSRGQGQECSRPRPRTKDTSASVLQKKKVFRKIFRRSGKKKKGKGLHKNFSGNLQNKTFSEIFFRLHELLTHQKIVLSSSRRQGNFRGLEASRPRTSKCVLEDSISGFNNVTEP